jgi:hypothetical protein
MEIHNETPCIAILNKKKSFIFQKQKTRRQNKSYMGGLVPVGGRRIQGKVVAGKYGGNIMYTCM